MNCPRLHTRVLRGCAQLKSLFQSLPLPLPPSLPFLSLSLLFFWARNAGPQTGSRQNHHSTAMGRTVITVSTMTQQRKQLLACCLSNKLPNRELVRLSAGTKITRLQPTIRLDPKTSRLGLLVFCPCDGGRFSSGTPSSSRSSRSRSTSRRVTSVHLRAKLPGCHGDAEGSLILGELPSSTWRSSS